MPEQSQEEQMEAIKKQCPFCKIASGEMQTKSVFSDEKMIAALDIRPAAKGHTVVFPKDHFMLFAQMPPDLFLHLFGKTGKIAGAVRKGTLSSGLTLFIANGGAAGQQAHHCTVHLIPRDENDKLNNFDYNKRPIHPGEIEKIKGILSQHITQRVMQAYQTAGIAPPKIKNKQPPMEQILAILDQNQQIKQMIISDPEKFKQIIPSNPQLSQLFSEVDINELSEILKKREAGGAK